MRSQYRVYGIGLLVILLCASLTLNFVLFNRSENYYRELNATRLDPLGSSFFPTSPEILLDATTVVFFGDSRAASWPSPDLDRFIFFNRGIGGQTSAQVAQRFGQHVTPLDPQIIVLQVGINDLKTIPLFSQDRDAIIANCKDNIELIVAKSAELNATIILTTIFPIGQVPLERKLFWSDDIAAAIDQVNTHIQSLQGNSVIVLDAFALLADNSGLVQSEYSSDFLHLNELAYQMLNDELTRLLVKWDIAHQD